MGKPKEHRGVLLIVAAFSRYAAALDWARQRTSERWGNVVLSSDRFAFTDTPFYEKEMGTDLTKQFFAFEKLIDPSELVQAKLDSNDWEREYAGAAEHEEARPLNLDPGYISEAKLVLATTKDRDHRLYLDRGICAEVTLYYHRGQWQHREWTYPDYRRREYHEFFVQCRDYLRERYRS